MGTPKRPKGKLRAFLLGTHFVLVFTVLVAVLSLDQFPDRVALEAGQVSPKTIKADRDVYITNEKATEEARRRAAKQVEPVYSYDPNAVLLSDQKVVETFDLLSDIALIRSQEAVDEAQLAEKIRALPIQLAPDSIELVTSADAQTLLELKTTTSHVLYDLMNGGITEDALAPLRNSLPEVLSDQLATIAEEYRPTVLQILSESLSANKEPDFEATQRAEQEAMAAVEPKLSFVPNGKKIVGEGELVSEGDIQVLKALGIYKPKLDTKRLAGYALLVFSLMLLVLAFMAKEKPEHFQSRRHLILLGAIVVATAIICRMLIGLSLYLAPVAIGSILVTMLLSGGLGLLVTGALAIYVGALSSSLAASAVTFITGAVAVMALSNVSNRSRVIWASLMVGVTNMLGAVTFTLMGGAEFASSVNDVGFGLLNGFLSAWLAVGALPMLEYFFGITTHLRLLDLSNQSEPLLQQLTREAPGTYQHSMMVANLAEQAARDIGADALLCRVGAYYHDIGKMKRPRFFIENQMGMENPHDKLNPSLSTKIIHSHVKDGIEMARQHRLPDVLVDFIAQHHGTSLVGYFFHQARSRSTEPVVEEDFRYPGPKPQTRESAILMLCDGLEAAARTLSNPTPEKICELVQKMVKHNLDDGQLDECDLSLKDINRIKESLTRSLQGIYHTRIEYPDANSLGGRRKVTQLRRKV